MSQAVKTADGRKEFRTRCEYVYGIEDIPWHEIAKRAKRSKRRNGPEYFEIPCAFDIETTTVNDPEKPWAFMYQWQFCIGRLVVFGRTWYEFTLLLNTIQRDMGTSPDGVRLVVYVHNLSFEFQFMHQWLEIVEGFYKEEKKPLKVTDGRGIEFRCSLALSNMSLQKFCENSPGVTHYKLVDTYDYRKFRDPGTPLTNEEKAYCYNDVRGLCECIALRMEEDTLARMPLTSTGYVRRDARHAMQSNWSNRRLFEDTALSPFLYELMVEAFRGGNTHANANFSGKTLPRVESFDITSSYPAIMVKGDFPIGAFTYTTEDTQRRIDPDMTARCYVFRVRLYKVRYTGHGGAPYIPADKCKGLAGIPDEGWPKRLDNGRVIQAAALCMAITEIDWKIIRQQYAFEAYEIYDMYTAPKGKLPAEYRECVMQYFRMKTELKGVPGKEYEYAKAKNRINSLYGLMAQKVITSNIRFENGQWIEEEIPLADALESFYTNKSSFLPYQWAVYVTAGARAALQRGIDLVGDDFVYADTDSIKYVGEHRADFDALNEILKEEAEEAGAFADNANGKRYYLGTWDFEGAFAFKTLGAKKYLIRTEDGTYYSTIAGVNKKIGAEYFQRHGFDAFKDGAVITNCGHLSAHYNEDRRRKVKFGDGPEFETGANVALIDGDYTIGITDEYEHLINAVLSNVYDLVYTT